MVTFIEKPCEPLNRGCAINVKDMQEMTYSDCANWKTKSF